MKTNLHCVQPAGSSPARALFAPVFFLAAVFGILSTSLPAGAQDGGQAAGAPARAVRLSYVDGTVHLAQGNQVIADKAVVNTPLLEGMVLATGDDGKAEIQFEDGSVARLAPDSSLMLKVLRGQGTSGQAEMDVSGGLTYFEMQGSGQVGPINVRFGDALVTTSGFTVMRIKDDTPPGELAVFSGNAHVQRDVGLSADVHGGENLMLSTSDVAESIEPDSWDTWNSDRDQELNAEAQAESGAPNDVNGGQNSSPAWNDLDANGTWYNVPDQGYVWSPYDASNADFDPYGNGNWMWMPGYGYTWVSGYSWGYLPYQCGAWNFYDGFGWGWAPGFGRCNPWWDKGIYLGPNIGYAPGWYHRLQRPVRPPGPRPGRPVPVIPVHRQPPVRIAGLPPRDPHTPITIGGHSVQPIHTQPVRNTFAGGMPGSRPGYSMPAPNRPVPQPGFAPARPVYTPVPRPEGAPGGNPGQRTYAPPLNPSQPARVLPPSEPTHTYAPATEPTRTYTPPAPEHSYTPPSQPSGGGARPSGGGGGSPSGGGGYHGGGSSGGGGGYHGGGGGGGGHSGGSSGGGGGHSGGGGGGGGGGHH